MIKSLLSLKMGVGGFYVASPSRQTTFTKLPWNLIVTKEHHKLTHVPAPTTPCTHLPIRCARTRHCCCHQQHWFRLETHQHDYQHHQRNYQQNSASLCSCSYMVARSWDFVASSLNCCMGTDCSTAEEVAEPACPGQLPTPSPHPLSSTMRNLKQYVNVYSSILQNEVVHTLQYYRMKLVDTLQYWQIIPKPLVMHMSSKYIFNASHSLLG